MKDDGSPAADARGTSPLGEPLLDAAAVAAHLGVDRSTVYRLAAAATLPAVEIAPKVLRFRPADVREFLERRTRRASPAGRVRRLLADRRAPRA